MSDSVATAVQLLNEALDRDPNAITQLVNLRVNCNEQLASQPKIQATLTDDGYRIGILGLLNGILATSSVGSIGAQGTIEKKTGKFRHIRRFIDLRTDHFDVRA